MTPADYGQRLERTRARMREAGIDGLLVSNEYNRRYLTGFPAHDGDISETSGWALVTERSLALISSSGALSGLEGEVAASGADVVRTDTVPLQQRVAERARAEGVRRLGFEEEWLSYYRYARVAAALDGSGVALVPTENIVEMVRARKDAPEIATMRRAADIANAAFARLMDEIHLGMTERQVAALLERLIVDLGAEGPSFATIVACGPGGETPHAMPRDRELRAGEPLLIDFGCRVDGYCSDLTRTVCIGEPSEKLVEIYGVVRAAQDAAMRALGAGERRGRDVDAAARRTIADAGYGDYFIHALGHGLGLAVHELPMFGWLRVQTPEADAELRAIERIETGNVVTNEPGIYLPGWGGVRLEDSLLITDAGGESLTERNPEHILTLPERR